MSMQDYREAFQREQAKKKATRLQPLLIDGQHRYMVIRIGTILHRLELDRWWSDWSQKRRRDVGIAYIVALLEYIRYIWLPQPLIMELADPMNELDETITHLIWAAKNNITTSVSHFRELENSFPGFYQYDLVTGEVGPFTLDLEDRACSLEMKKEILSHVRCKPPPYKKDSFSKNVLQCVDAPAPILLDALLDCGLDQTWAKHFEKQWCPTTCKWRAAIRAVAKS